MQTPLLHLRSLLRVAQLTKVPRVTADTNIYISALNFGGTPQRFLRFAEAGVFQLVTSDPIPAEVTDVLRGEKFAWPEPEPEGGLTTILFT